MVRSGRNTDRPCESIFGGFKYEHRRFDNIAHASSAAVGLARHGGLLGKHGDEFAAAATKRKPRVDDSPRKGAKSKQRRVGHLNDHGPEVKASIMRVGRRAAGRERRYARFDRRVAAAAKLERRQGDIDKAQEKQVKEFVKAGESFSVAPLRDLAALDAALARDASKTAKLRTLKGQIDLVVAGYGMKELKPPKLSSAVDPLIGEAGSDANLAYLRRTLADIWARAEGAPRPAAPAVPALYCRDIIIMGEATSELGTLRAEFELSEEELKARAEKLRADKPKRQTRKAAPAPPSIDSALVGRRISAVWENTYIVKRKKIVRIESCPGVVLRISNKETIVNGKKIGLGWIYVKYDEGEENDHCWWKAEKVCYRSDEPGGWKIVEEEEEGESGLESYHSDSDISGDEKSDSGSAESSSSDESEMSGQ